MLFFLIRGFSKGLVMMIAGLVALVAGIFGGSYVAKLFSWPVADTFILPWVRKSLNLAAQGQQLPQGAVLTGSGRLSESAAGSITGVMESSSLPGFSFSGTISNIGHRVSETGTNLLNAAANVISERIAYIVLFVVAFILIQLLVVLLFRFINLVSKAPVLNSLNRWTGAAAGLLIGALLILLLMWVVSTFVKPATAPGGILSQDVIERSYVAKYFDAAKNAILY
jgi:uncharacterized membrane protein required for colicin V production